jgi:hypothetical protein
MINAMLIANIIAWVSCVVFFVATIISKKRCVLRNIKIAYIGIFGYLLISNILYAALDLNVGLELLIYCGADAICLLLMTISLIVSKVKWKKFPDEENKTLSRWLYLYLIPIMLILVSFGIEFHALQQADILLIEKNGWFKPNSYYAITDRYCLQVDLGESVQKQGEKVLPIYDPYDYPDWNFSVNVPVDDESTKITTLSRSQLNMFRAIAQYDGLTKEMNLNGNVQQSAEIYILGSTDYYLVQYCITNGSNYWYPSAIFLRDQFVDNIDASYPDQFICYQ